MRLGVYLGRHAGTGGGIGVYARTLVELLPELLSGAPEGAERTEDRPEHSSSASGRLPASESSVSNSRGSNFRGADPNAGGFQELVFYGDRSILTAELVRTIGPSQATFRLLPQRLPRMFEFLLDQYRVPKMLAADRIDLLHSTSNTGILKARQPQVVTVHDLFQGWPPANSDLGRPTLSKRLKAAFYRSFFRGLSRSNPFYITDCAEVGQELSVRLGVNTERISTIPLGLAPEFVEAMKLEASKSPSGIVAGCGSEYVLAFASMDPRKNLQRIVKAWQLLPDESKSRGLVLLGADAAVRTVVASLLADVEKKFVKCIEWVSINDLVQLYRRSAVVLVPTLGEGFGFPVIEAIASGKAVVCGEIPHLQALARRHPGVCCCAADSTASIASTLLSAIELRFVDSAAARPRTMEHSTAELVALYKKLATSLEGKRRGRMPKNPVAIGAKRADSVSDSSARHRKVPDPKERR